MQNKTFNYLATTSIFFSLTNLRISELHLSILKSMLGGLKNKIVGGDPILSHTISLKTVESEIADSLTNVQNNNKDVEIGSYPFFQAGKLGVSIVIRSDEQLKIDKCSFEILEFVNQKKIEIVVR